MRHREHIRPSLAWPVLSCPFPGTSIGRPQHGQTDRPPSNLSTLPGTRLRCIYPRQHASRLLSSARLPLVFATSQRTAFVMPLRKRLKTSNPSEVGAETDNNNSNNSSSSNNDNNNNATMKKTKRQRLADFFKSRKQKKAQARDAHPAPVRPPLPPPTLPNNPPPPTTQPPCNHPD